MSLCAYERETVINMNDADDFAIIITYQRTLITRLRRNPAAELLEQFEYDGSPGARFKVPAKLITIRNPQPPISPERRAQLADNAAKARESRSG